MSRFFYFYPVHKEPKYYNVDQAKLMLERFCIYQERSPFEVEQKLLKLGLIREAMDQILMHLHQENFLNETRFAEAYVRGKFNQKKWGRNKISQGLFQHRVSSYNSKAALAQINEEAYLNTATTLAEKKLTVLSSENEFEKKQKIVRYLVQRGFEQNIAFEIINNLFSS